VNTKLGNLAKWLHKFCTLSKRPVAKKLEKRKKDSDESLQLKAGLCVYFDIFFNKKGVVLNK